MFVGGLAETPIEDGVMGVTFTLLLALQFEALLTGDRSGQSALLFHGPYVLCFVKLN